MKTVSNWNQLTELCKSGFLSIEDAKELIRNEAATKRRKPILRRLVGYLKSREREQMLKELGV